LIELIIHESSCVRVIINHDIVDFDIDQALFGDGECGGWAQFWAKLLPHDHFEAFIISLGFGEELLVGLVMGEDAVILEVLFLEAGEDIAFPIFVADVVCVAAAAAILGIRSRCSVMLFEVWPVSVRLSIKNMNHNQILFLGFAPSQSSCSCQAIKSSFIWSETLLRCWINFLKPEHALVHRS
jgi:hypothetical protein